MIATGHGMRQNLPIRRKHGSRFTYQFTPSMMCGTKRDMFDVMKVLSSLIPMPRASSPTIQDPMTAWLPSNTAGGASAWRTHRDRPYVPSVCAMTSPPRTIVTFRPFSRTKWLANEITAKHNGTRIIIEVGRQKIGMVRRHFPQKRQDRLRRQQHLPRWLHELRSCHRLRPPERIGQHPLPWIKLEKPLDRSPLQIDEAIFREPDVAHVEDVYAASRLMRTLCQIRDRSAIFCIRHRSEMQRAAR